MFVCIYSIYSLYLHNDVVDRDVNEFHEETDESHHSKPYCRRQGNALELCKEEWSVCCSPASTKLCAKRMALPFMSGLVHRFTSRIESFAKSFTGLT